MLAPRQICLSLLSLTGIVFLGACNATPKSSGEGAGGGSAGATNSQLEECRDFQGAFASEVLDYEFGEGQSYGQSNFPEAIFGGPDGRGPGAGSMDVVSLGDGGFVQLGFSGRSIIDGPGPDFIVFENPFEVGDEGDVFYELGRVSVSVDGESWIEFPCEVSEPPAGSCAGWHTVLASVKNGRGDPFDPLLSGGDAYDLKDLGLSEVRYVRVADVEGDTDRDGNEAIFDLDAVAVVNGRCD